MHTLTTKSGSRIELFESIQDLPMRNSNAFNKALLFDAGVGSTPADLDKHFQKLFMFLGAEKDMKKEAIAEATNMYYQWVQALEDFNIKYVSFACLVHSIDGTEYRDLTESGLLKTIAAIEKTGLTDGELGTWLEGVKKNLMKNVGLPSRKDLTDLMSSPKE